MTARPTFPAPMADLTGDVPVVRSGGETRLLTDDELAAIFIEKMAKASPRKADRLPRLAPVDTPPRFDDGDWSPERLVGAALVVVAGIVTFLLIAALVVSQAMMWAGWW